MRSLTIGLVGNPNCGKTALFNALTGAHQHVGNWPGVTVERVSGVCHIHHHSYEIIDLPGTYSFITAADSASLDERIACETILQGDIQLIVNVIDASHLERNLYLTLQLMEMRCPMIVVLNMMDVVLQRGMQIDVEKLQQLLGCPVVVMEAHRAKGVKELKRVIESVSQKGFSSDKQGVTTFGVPTVDVASLVSQMGSLSISLDKTWLAMRLLEGDVFAEQFVTQEVKAQAERIKETIRQVHGEDPDILFADARYRHIETLLAGCVTAKAKATPTRTSRIDTIVLNRVLGIPIFLGIMYCMFLFTINVGGAFQDFFDIGSNTLFVQGLCHVLTLLHLPDWLTAVLANGVGRGINTTLTFIPVIGAMFLFLSFLEDSGYMARAAFVVDRLMRALGLPGKSFVPMIVGFGCNVPAVMATRTLDNKRDRILTVMMSPFMSCGARLAIYAVFTAAFFPVGGQNIVFALYLIGIVMAMLTGLVLRKTVLQGEPAPLVMELPPYHMPHGKTVLRHTWQRLKGFVMRAGKLIIPVCVLIGLLNTINIDGTLNSGEGDVHSLLSQVGGVLTPIFAPMGIHQDNWPATVGLMTGVLAKEVVVGTLNELYTQIGHLATLHASGFSLWHGLHEALMSIPQNFRALTASFSNPVMASAPVHTLNQGVYGLMAQRFDGQIGAIAYLLFVLLYFPCVSTTAAMLREVHRGWTVFSVLWTTGLAYCVAVLFYQAATWLRHPVESTVWIMGIVAFMALTIMGINRFVKNKRSIKSLQIAQEAV